MYPASRCYVINTKQNQTLLFSRAPMKRRPAAVMLSDCSSKALMLFCSSCPDCYNLACCQWHHEKPYKGNLSHLNFRKLYIQEVCWMFVPKLLHVVIPLLKIDMVCSTEMPKVQAPAVRLCTTSCPALTAAVTWHANMQLHKASQKPQL